MPDREAIPGRSVKTGRPFLLSKRERQVLALVAQGLSAEVISERLVISLHTANTHFKVIREKLQAKNLAHAVALGAARRQIDLDTIIDSGDRQGESHRPGADGG